VDDPAIKTYRYEIDISFQALLISLEAKLDEFSKNRRSLIDFKFFDVYLKLIESHLKSHQETTSSALYEFISDLLFKSLPKHMQNPEEKTELSLYGGDHILGLLSYNLDDHWTCPENKDNKIYDLVSEAREKLRIIEETMTKRMEKVEMECRKMAEKLKLENSMSQAAFEKFAENTDMRIDALEKMLQIKISNKSHVKYMKSILDLRSRYKQRLPKLDQFEVSNIIEEEDHTVKDFLEYCAPLLIKEFRFGGKFPSHLPFEFYSSKLLQVIPRVSSFVEISGMYLTGKKFSLILQASKGVKSICFRS
jgi:hypothetical protein